MFPNRKLYAIDVRVNLLDPAWPITAQAPVEGNIHVNPKFLAIKVCKPTSRRTYFYGGISNL